LCKDEDCQEKIPINPDSDDLFHAFDDGLVLCKLLIKADEESVDARALNRKKNMNVYEIRENLKLGISACKGLGMKMVGVDPKDFIDKTPHLILAVVWQVIRAVNTKAISLKDTPEIMRLAEEGEELVDLMKLPPE